MAAYEEFKRLAHGKGILEVHARREYWELVILDELLQAKFAPFLILKGGMALRLKYQSPRFSNDIDLGALQDVPHEEFRKAVHRIAEKHGLTVTDDHDNYSTLYANFMVPGDTRKGNINIKIELSKRHNIRAQGREYAAFASDLFPKIHPTGYVLTAESMYENKRLCLKTRQKPRDIFDFWYLSQVLHRRYEPVPISPESEKLIKEELRQYLPRRLHAMVDELVVVKSQEKEAKKGADETEGYYPADWGPAP